jgi:hypothetical protein
MTEQNTEEPPVRPLRGGPVIGGLLLGVIVCWVWIAATLFTGVALSYGEYTSDPVAIAVVALAALPLVVGIVLLVRPRTRQMGAGFLMGLSIGMIAGAGVCASLYVPSLG